MARLTMAPMDGRPNRSADLTPIDVGEDREGRTTRGDGDRLDRESEPGQQRIVRDREARGVPGRNRRQGHQGTRIAEEKDTERRDRDSGQCIGRVADLDGEDTGRSGGVLVERTAEQGAPLDVDRERNRLVGADIGTESIRPGEVRVEQAREVLGIGPSEDARALESIPDEGRLR